MRYLFFLLCFFLSLPFAAQGVKPKAKDVVKTDRVAVARFAQSQGNLKEAIAQLDTLRFTDPQHSEVVEVLPLYLIQDGQLDRAFPLVLDFVANTRAGNSSLRLLRFLYLKQPDRVYQALADHRREQPQQVAWPIAQGFLLGVSGRICEATDCYQAAWDVAPSKRLGDMLTWGYDNLAKPERALFYLRKTIAMCSEREALYSPHLPRLLFECDSVDAAFNVLNDRIAKADSPTSLLGARMAMGISARRFADAMSDCEYVLAVQPEDVFILSRHARLLYYLGRTTEARPEFERIIKIDKERVGSPDELPTTITDFALFFLGRAEEAEALAHRRLATDRSANNLYDAACLYSLMRKTDIALDYLRQAMDAGYLKIYHIKVDRDLDNLRQLPEFSQLVNHYHQMVKTGELPKRK